MMSVYLEILLVIITLFHRGSHIHNPTVVVCTHVCNQIKCVIIMFYISFEYTKRQVVVM